RVAQHVLHLIALRPCAVRAGEVLTLHQRPDAVLLVANEATPLQFRMDALIDLHARAIIGRNHQRVLRRLCILLRNRRDALVVALNLVDAALPVKILYRLAYFAPCKLLNYLFQFWVFLAHDLFELHRFHAGVLELREGRPGLNRLMLPPVTDEQHTVIRMEPGYKLMHLPGRCQRGFVEHIEALLAGIWLPSTCQMLL